jgi:hypothetical protein
MLRHLVWPRLLDPDRLASYQCMRIADGALHTGQGERCLTVWRLPQVNLAVASVSAKRRHRAQWGAFLDGLGHEVTIVVRARKPIDGPFSTQRSHASAIFRTSALLTSTPATALPAPRAAAAVSTDRRTLVRSHGLAVALDRVMNCPHLAVRLLTTAVL